MTQKPPEIFVTGRYVCFRGDKHSDNGVLTNVEDRPDYTRYILAAPKEDVEAAVKMLDGLDDFIQDGCSARPEDKSHALSALETIRRVLLANAGRKE